MYNIIKAKKIKSFGKKFVKLIRRNNMIPSVVYGYKISRTNLYFAIPYKEFMKLYLTGSVLSSLIEIKLGEKYLRVIPADIQIDPVSERPIHIDFYFIRQDIPLRTKVYIKVMNRDKCIGIKRGGRLNVIKQFLLLSCLPGKAIRVITIDIQNLVIGDSISVVDLNLPKGVKHCNKNNYIILSVVGTQKSINKIKK